MSLFSPRSGSRWFTTAFKANAVVPGYVAVSKLMQQVKGVSARFANGELPLPVFLEWQKGYHALSVSASDVERVKPYVLCQKQRHVYNDPRQEWEHSPDD